MATFTTGDGVGLHHTDDGDGPPVVPAGLSAIVTLDQTPRMINGDGWEYGFYGLTEANAGTFFDGGIPATGRGKADRHTGFRKLQALLGYDPPFADPALRALLRDHAAQDWRDVVARVSVPALFLTARDSQLWPCEHAGRAASVNERATVVTLDDCGHAIAVDQPDAVSATMVEFLR